MPLGTDLSFPVTAKRIGPLAASPSTVLPRPKVYYLKSSDLLKVVPDTLRNAVTIFEKTGARRQIPLYESPDELLAMQALAQGATNSIVFTKVYQNLAPTSSATAADQNTASKYYNEISTINGGGVRLPDAFVKRLVVLVNATTGSILVYPRAGTAAYVNGSTGVYTLLAGARKHFVAPTAATAGTTAPWRIAVDA